MEITDIRHDWPEKAGFTLVRPTGIEIYTFLHFMNSVEIEINREKVTVRPGACIFYAPDEPQWFHSDSNLTHNWAHFAPGFRVQLLRYRIPQNTLLYPRAAEFISGLFRKTEAAFFSNEPFREDLLEAYTTEFLVRFSRAIAEENYSPTVSRADREKMQNLRHTVLSDPEKHWTVPQMASLASVSASHLHALYRAVFGTSPMRDLIEARIRYAQSLLLSGSDLPITPSTADMQTHTISSASLNASPAKHRPRTAVQDDKAVKEKALFRPQKGRIKLLFFFKICLSVVNKTE